MSLLRLIAAGYALVLSVVGALNFIPGVVDEQGLCFGIFALDPFDDALHFGSAAWAGIAALVSARASRLFLTVFGALYLGDGLMGLAVGSGYLDLGIVRNGPLLLPFGFKILANLPHIGLGGLALGSGLILERR